MSFDSLTLDHGYLPEEPSEVYYFKFKNIGKSPLIISRCQTSDPHVAEWSKEPVLPGKRGEIKVVMPTRGRQGPFTKSITILSNAPSNMALAIKGIIVPDSSR